jgi:hypothetical protein
MTEDDAELLVDVRQALRREEYYDTPVIEFLLRLLDEERAKHQWRPIETAPENESILIYIPNCEHYGEGVYRGMLANMGTGQHWSANAVSMGRSLGPDTWPTHWMPLPEPPR